MHSIRTLPAKHFAKYSISDIALNIDIFSLYCIDRIHIYKNDYQFFQELSGRQSLSTQHWLHSLSFRRPSSQNSNFGNSDTVVRSYSMRQNPKKIMQLINGKYVIFKAKIQYFWLSFKLKIEEKKLSQHEQIFWP